MPGPTPIPTLMQPSLAKPLLLICLACAMPCAEELCKPFTSNVYSHPFGSFEIRSALDALWLSCSLLGSFFCVSLILFVNISHAVTNNTKDLTNLSPAMARFLNGQKAAEGKGGKGKSKGKGGAAAAEPSSYVTHNFIQLLT